MTLQSIEERKVKFDLIVVVITVDEYLNIFPNVMVFDSAVIQLGIFRIQLNLEGPNTSR